MQAEVLRKFAWQQQNKTNVEWLLASMATRSIWATSHEL